MIKTTIYLPDELHQEIKQAAKERGISEAPVSAAMADDAATLTARHRA